MAYLVCSCLSSPCSWSGPQISASALEATSGVLKRDSNTKTIFILILRRKIRFPLLFGSLDGLLTKYIDIRGSKIRLLLIGLQPYIDSGIRFFLRGVIRNG